MPKKKIPTGTTYAGLDYDDINAFNDKFSTDYNLGPRKGTEDYLICNGHDSYIIVVTHLGKLKPSVTTEWISNCSSNYQIVQTVKLDDKFFYKLVILIDCENKLL